jgi:carbonic anhydrase
MNLAKPLPSYLVQRYHGWKATSFADNRAWYRKMASDGQHPRAMIISCCDSRVNVISIFGADHGELFIHRNVANLVPAYKPDGLEHGTSAAIEYAVEVLKVAHLIVLGHSNCGGVQGCMNMCSGASPELDATDSFVGRWMDILRPRYEVVKGIPDEAERLRALEKQAVMISLENLMTFPWLSAKVASGELTLHGMWTDIGEGGLEYYNPGAGTFLPV